VHETLTDQPERDARQLAEHVPPPWVRQPKVHRPGWADVRPEQADGRALQVVLAQHLNDAGCVHAGPQIPPGANAGDLARPASMREVPSCFLRRDARCAFDARSRRLAAASVTMTWPGRASQAPVRS
jgi:hypothetical protein